MWCVVVCHLETSRMKRPWPALGRSATKKKVYYTQQIIHTIDTTHDTYYTRCILHTIYTTYDIYYARYAIHTIHYTVASSSHSNINFAILKTFGFLNFQIFHFLSTNALLGWKQSNWQ